MDVPLPSGYELLWGLRERPRRGPKPGLSIEGIVQAAIDLADAEGLAAVSMSRVAAQLGFTPMALYRYVESKDHLLSLMVDTVVSAAPLTEPAGPQWRPALENWTWVQVTVLNQHPWILQIPITGPPLTPGQMRWIEQGLRILSVTGLPESDKVAVLGLLASFALSEARLAVDLSSAAVPGDTQGTALPSYGDLLRRLIDPERFPAVHASLVAGAWDGPPEYTEEDAKFGLYRVLDGVEMLVERRAREASAG
ncbi:MAG: TetR/AcrR family transcriptional regulator [Jiangellaceae bacterium]